MDTNVVHWYMRPRQDAESTGCYYCLQRNSEPWVPHPYPPLFQIKLQAHLMANGVAKYNPIYNINSGLLWIGVIPWQRSGVVTPSNYWPESPLPMGGPRCPNHLSRSDLSRVYDQTLSRNRNVCLIDRSTLNHIYSSHSINTLHRFLGVLCTAYREWVWSVSTSNNQPCMWVDHRERLVSRVIAV